MIGDDFVANTYYQYYQNMNWKTAFMKENFQLEAFSVKSYKSNMKNALARVRSQFCKALESSHLLPRIIVVVLDNDMIRHFKADDEGISLILKEIMIWLFKEVDKLINRRKRELPQRSKRNDYPQIFWVEAPQQVNFTDNLARRKFNSVVQSTAGAYDYMKIIRMKKIWGSR